jgi:ABC-type branched-subunit amino acid transport system ATPase component
VLDFGHLISEGSTAEVMADEKVRQAYFGDVEGGSGS